MASYYIMNNIDELKTARVEISKASPSFFEATTQKEFCEIVNARNAKIFEFMRQFPIIEGTRKAEVIADACRYCDMKGIVEADIVKPAKSNYSKASEQMWHIYKVDGKWFFKMNRDCKATHEVAF